MEASRRPHTPRPEEALRKAGLRATPQRVAILGALEGDETHPTAQALHERLQTAHPGMSFATVYNTLSALMQVGKVRALTLGGPTRFDPNASPHHHAICDGCGAVRDVPLDSAGGDAPLDAEVLDGFRVHRVERIYRGLCVTCRAASSRPQLPKTQQLLRTTDRRDTPANRRD